MPKSKALEKKEDEKPKNAWVTMPELIEMKAYQLQGFSIKKIAEKTKRNWKTVKNSLVAFEELLPEAADLKNKILERVDEIKEQMMQNAEMIINKADMQVVRKVYDEETSAIDAAKISQIYASRLGSMAGFADKLPGGGEVEKTPRVVNFINNIINITNKKDDRFKPTSRPEERIIKDEPGRKKNVIERIMS